MASVTLDKVQKNYGTFKVLQAVDLEIADGEFVVLVGPSGCGKSTLLRMIAGLEEVSAGEIRIGERVVNDVAPKDRDIAMVFQSYALYPHMNVADNMGFSLILRKTDEQAIGQRVERSGKATWARPFLAVSRASFPAASGSASPWAALSCAIRRFSCSTSRCPISTPNCASICAPRSRRYTSN